MVDIGENRHRRYPLNTQIVVVSDGRTGREWAKSLVGSPRNNAFVQQLLASHEFSVTTGVEYRVEILKASELPEGKRDGWGAVGEAYRRNWDRTPREVLPLLNEALTDEAIRAMDLDSIIVMQRDLYFSVPFEAREIESSWRIAISARGQYRLVHVLGEVRPSWASNRPLFQRPLDVGFAFISSPKFILKSVFE